MRVALVCGAYTRDRDGVADYVGMLAAALPPAGVEPVVLSAAGADPGALVAATRWDARGTAAAARTLRRLAPDLVHVQFAPSAYRYSPAVGLLPLLLGRGGPPVVVTLHEYGWWSWPARVPGALWRPLERGGVWDRETGALGTRAAALVVTNAGHGRAVRDRLGRAPEVVPLGTNVLPTGGGEHDRRLARGQVRAELGLAPDAPLLAFFGFVHPVKGVRYLLAALAALRARWADLHLLVLGGFASLALPGEEAASFRRELAEQAAAYGVASAVTFTGHRPAGEASRLLSAADAVVLPFTAGVTTKSGSLLAAWAHGLPAVVTAAEEADPDVVDGSTAVVVGSRRDAPALAEGVARLLDDASLRARVGAGGAERARDRSWPRIAAEHARVYRQVLAS